MSRDDAKGSAPPAPESPNPRWALRLLAGFVVVQLIVPLTYYLREDPYDERFAWRMFSAIRLHTCDTSARETEGGVDRELDLDLVIHRAWRNTMSRNRRDVIHRFLAHRCATEGRERVEVRNECRTPSGTQLEPQVYVRECATGEVTEPPELIVPAEQAP